MRASTVAEAYGVCATLAEERARTARVGDFADGYRCAAEHIATAIRQERDGQGRTQLERDLRDAEVEARTLARVVDVASDVVEDNKDDSRAVDAIRQVLTSFFDDEDLPVNLRRHRAARSSSRLVASEASQSEGALRRPTRVVARGSRRPR